jgi:hypothetical protein
MAFNWGATESNYFVDQENKMMLSKNYSWNPTGSNGKGDAIGRNKDAWFAYRDPRFIEGVKNCWVKIEEEDGYYWKGHRYPTEEYLEKDFSRDHTSNTFVLMKLTGEDEWAKEIASHVKFTIAEKHITSKGRQYTHRFTLGLWGYVKSIAGKWWGKPLFYGITFIEAILYNLQNGLCYLMGEISREYKPEDYDKNTMTRQKQSKWTQTWASLSYPVYAMNLTAWQLFVMKDGFMKRLIQYMFRPLIPRYNYMLKLLFNVGKVKKEDVINYKSMKGGRWSTPLNEINDRDVHIITDPKRLEYNVQDKDILIAMWNHRNPDDQI